MLTMEEIAVPEPDLTPDELAARARALRDRVRAEAPAAEVAGRYSPELHRAFVDAGFFRILQPRRYGGYGFDLETFLRVTMTIAEGDMGTALREQVAACGLAAHVRFLGQVEPARLAVPLSAADVFVLATSYEGWANVFLEAMACGLPVVTTRVGGNAEVVTSDRLGTLVAFGDATALESAIVAALEHPWDRDEIVAHAARHGWDARIAQVLAEWDALLESRPPSAARTPAQPVSGSPRDHNAIRMEDR